jgi:hypothetical protein
LDEPTGETRGSGADTVRVAELMAE